MKKNIEVTSLNIGVFYQHIDDGGGYPRDVLRLFDELNKTDSTAFKLKDFKSFKKLSKKVDLIHLFGVFTIPAILVTIYCRLFNIPYIITTFSHLEPLAIAKSPFKKRLFIFLIGKFMLKNALAIHVFAESEEISLNKLGIIRVPIMRIPLGVYPEDLNLEKVENNSKIQIHKPYLLFLGRLDIYQKGIDILIDGFIQYISIGDKYNLIICGKDWQGSTDYIKTRIKPLKMKERIIFLGEVEYEQIDSLMANSEAFIYPSRFDGPPRPLRHALVNGQKLLVSAQSNLADNIEENGWGLQFDANANAICESILKFERKENWPNYKDPLKILGWDKLAKDYLKMYRTLISEIN